MNQPTIDSISPFFIVQNVPASISFYCQLLGFRIVHQEPTHQPFFAIVQRDNAMLFLKAVGVEPVPNHQRNPDARWDA
ncbi:MAG TPA: VOC family protein [Candidatus Acidoferrum sp.]|jgi:catechol 2,3-dioxygenase-like lactoylglutathione lyase family enzyme